MEQKNLNIKMTKNSPVLVLIIFFVNISFYSTFTYSNEKDPVWNTGADDISHLKGKNSQFKKGYDALMQAKKFKKKGKIQKAVKRYNDSIKFFLADNKLNPDEPATLYYLGYAYRNVGDDIMAEIYYEQGLEINPKHVDINKNLGQLYVETNRINKAKERLTALENCNCIEFDKLRFLIQKIN